MGKKLAGPKALMTPAKKPRNRTPAYKMVTCSNSVRSLIADGVSQLEELASECREMVDNASEGLAETQRIQTFGETADALEGISEPDMPDELDTVLDTVVAFSESVPTRKGRGTSRSVQRDNAVSMLSAAVEALQDVDDNEAADELATEVQNIIDEAEGCEFPGMYG